MLVKNGAKAADYDTCRQCLCSLVNHCLDMWIGMNLQLNAVDIAIIMERGEILNTLRGNGFTGVRCGRTMTCNLADHFPSVLFIFQRVSDLGFVACNWADHFPLSPLYLPVCKWPWNCCMQPELIIPLSPPHLSGGKWPWICHMWPELIISLSFLHLFPGGKWPWICHMWPEVMISPLPLSFSK